MGNILGARSRKGKSKDMPQLYPDVISILQGHYVDGLRAPVVIHPSKEVHSYDEEYIIVLSEWYHEQHDDLLKQFISISNPGGAEPVPGKPPPYAPCNVIRVTMW